MWDRWCQVWGWIGLADFVSRGRGDALMLPPKWAAIAVGFQPPPVKP